MQLVTYAKTSLALLYIGFICLALSTSSTYNIYIAIFWMAWNIYTLKRTAEVIEVYARLGALFPWYVVIIPVLLFDLWLGEALATMGGVATRELASWETGAMLVPVISTSNLVTLPASSFKAIVTLIVATIAVKKALPKLAAYDREGKKLNIEVEHPYFSQLKLFPKRSSSSRWEAEYNLKSKYSTGKVIISAEDNYVTTDSPEPTEKELQFCKRYLSNLSLVFPVVYDGVQQGWKTVSNELLPYNWEKECQISEFTVPANGEQKNNWEVVLYVKKADDYIFISVEDGKSRLRYE